MFDTLREVSLSLSVSLKLGDGCDGREECKVTVKEKWREYGREGQKGV